MKSKKSKSTAEKSKEGLVYLSLFSGAMGLDIGLERAGFTAAACNEIDPLAVETIRRNRPEIPVLPESVEEVDAKALSKAAGRPLINIDLIAGGPPCQAFSVFGQRRGVFDGRGKMLGEFLRLVREIQPKTFLMENVRGLHSMPILPKSVKLPPEFTPDPDHQKPGSLLRSLLKQFEEIGYRVDVYIVNSVNYGSPQIRERLICIGNRYGLQSNFPKPLFSNRPEDGLPPFKTLGDIIGNGFIDPDPDLMNFSPRKLKYLAMVPPGGNWRSMPVDIQKESMGKSWFLKGGRSAYWRRLSMDYPCPTVVTMPNHAGTSMCHPSELRALTVGEMAAVQEFPKDWRFEGSATDKCRQIGNAVPPRLGEVAGRVILDLLSRIKAGEKSSQSQVASGQVIHLRPHVRTRSYFKNGKVISGAECYYHSQPTNPDQLELSFTDQ